MDSAQYSVFKDECRTSINPNVSNKAIDEMLISHMLTRQIFEKVFTIAGFLNQNAIASQLEKLRISLSQKNVFNESDFLKRAIGCFWGFHLLREGL